MERPTAKIEFWNSRKRPHVISVEPWGEDFTLLPEEKLEVVAWGNSENPHFTAVESEDGTQIYIDGAQEFAVNQDGKRIECGHKRQGHDA